MSGIVWNAQDENDCLLTGSTVEKESWEKDKLLTD